MSEQENETKQKDFYQKVLTSFKSREYTEDEAAQKKVEWQKYEEKPEQSRYSNDFPNYFFAGFWIRLWAFLIDLLCINAMTTILLDATFTWFDIERSTEFLSAYSLLALLIYLIYFTFLTKLNKGQTIGKMIFGIRVICLTEKKFKLENSFY